MHKKRPHLMLLLLVVMASISAFLRFAISPEHRIGSNSAAQVNLLVSPAATSGPIAPEPELQAAAFSRFLNFFSNRKPGVDFNLAEPVGEFRQRITKKSFGIYITPKTSPVENDKFIGYHTGVDVEFSDYQDEVPVFAIADGEIVARSWIAGYGGMIAVSHKVGDKSIFALYGHLDEDSFLPEDVVDVKAGERLGILGDDHSSETDGARKHLHFAVYTGEKMDFRGYVPTEAELSGWLNPLDLY